jgi:hypothetical protein
MTLRSDGRFGVKSNETVTVTVQAENTEYLAAISGILTGSWGTITPPNPEMRTFTVDSSFSQRFNFSISFDFTRDENGNIPAGARYELTVSGEPGGHVERESIVPVPLLPTTRDYFFAIENGA